MIVSREGGTVGYPVKILGLWIPSLFLLRHRRDVIKNRWRNAVRLAFGQLSFVDGHYACEMIDNAYHAQKRKSVP